jgi:surfeit locus 1 family protein
VLLLHPRFWGAHLLMVLALAAAVALGIWQYDVWGAHRTAEARDLTSAAPTPLADVFGPDDVLTGNDNGRPVTLQGEWLPSSTLYVADRDRPGSRGGRTGYWVMTPVVVGDSAMPVVRGWSPTPSAPPVQGSTAITGWLQAGEGSGLPDDDPTDDVIPEMRIASIVQHVDMDLYGAFVVERDGAGSDGLVGVTPASIPQVSSTTSLRNLLYAFQWWVFGAFAVYIWVRWCRDVLEAERQTDEETDVPEQVPSSA